VFACLASGRHLPIGVHLFDPFLRQRVGCHGEDVGVLLFLGIAGFLFLSGSGRVVSGGNAVAGDFL
jgi:hypothetical protein